MRAYVGQINPAGLRRFLCDEAVPEDRLRQLAHAWCSPATTVVWAVLADENADAVRRELAAGHHQAACGLLLNHAAEILPVTAVPELR
jgi:hypothetical protein